MDNKETNVTINQKYHFLKALEKKIYNLEQIEFIDQLKNEILQKIDNELEKCNDSEAEYLLKLKNRIQRVLGDQSQLESLYKNSKYCDICSRRFKIEHFIDHVLDRHQKYFIIDVMFQLKKIENDKPLNKKQQNKLNRILKRDQSELEKIINQIVYEPLEKINYTLEKISSLEYNNEILFKDVKEAIKELESTGFAKVLAKEQVRNYSKRYKELKKLFSEKQGRVEFLKLNCNSVYVTWDDIEFENTQIRIKKNSILVGIKNSRTTLNKVKDSFFKKNFGHEVYKFVFKDGNLREELSTGVNRVEDLINFKNRIKRISINSGSWFHLFTPSMSRYKILKQIKSEWNLNQYLTNCAGLLKETDKVRAVVECNNEKHEECLLFSINSKNINYLIWENINAARATYVFLNTKIDQDDFLDMIRHYLEDVVINRRQVLSNNNRVLINEMPFKYQKIVHNSVHDHLLSLKNLVNYP